LAAISCQLSAFSYQQQRVQRTLLLIRIACN